MTTSPDRELQRWMDAWQADEGERTAPDAIRAHVRRRTAQLAVWLVVEAAVSAAALALVIRGAIMLSSPLDRLAMALLALIAAGALALSWWNWGGTIRATGRTTSEFVALSAERTRRLRRGVALGWGVLAAEVLVLAPWVWHRLYGGITPPTAGAERFAWGLLVGLTSLAALLLGAAHVSSRREARRIDELREELGDG
jgi:hypothetical protein